MPTGDTATSAQDLSKLSLAFDRANTSISRTGQAFGELARSSQEWNIISRILSGTGMWRIQNQIRAVGNIINVMHKKQEEATLKLAESMEDIAAAKKKLEAGGQELKDDPIFKFFSSMDGVDAKKEFKTYWGYAEKQVEKAQKSIVKSFMPTATKDYLKGGFRADEVTGKGGTINFLKQRGRELTKKYRRGEGGLLH